MFTKKEKPKANSIESNKRAPFFQAKLKVGKAGDKYEVEADKMADKVVNNETTSNAVQKKEGEEEVQQKPLASEISPLIQKAETLEEEPVQKMEEEEPVQKKEEEDVQQKEEEEPVQKMEEEEVQQKEEEEVQAKSTNNSNKSPSIESKLRNGSGGTKMDNQTKNEMESGFGADFSQVNIHNDNEAAQMSQDIGAQAFTHGNDVYFNQGKYNPNSKEGKHLLAHELTHTVQQKGMIQKNIQKSPNSWRYTLPKKVKRSIIEIQGIVGETPDGVYGPKTKAAVIRYQKLLKKKKLYKKAIDGKWGIHTDSAHNLFSVAPNAHRFGYNCAGFAMKKFVWVDLIPTKNIYSKMKQLKTPTEKCNPFDFKFWYWEMDVQVRDTVTGRISTKSRDFHTVGGRTDKDGKGPSQVMSKNGPRPLEGPGTPLSWQVKSGSAIDQNGIPSPTLNWVITNVSLKTFCSKKLP